MRQLKIEGIVLANKNFFEKDKLITVFSKELGKCRILVKSANNQKYKLVGKIFPTNHIKAELYQGKSFLLLNQCEIITAFPNLRTDLDRIKLAFAFFDIVLKSSEFEISHVNLFDLLLKSLNLLEQNNANLGSITKQFQKQFLETEGLLGENEIVTSALFKEKFSIHSGKSTII
ncbi:MAG: DNA repair protein RecO [Candidatus Margulisiibacteriota bacterium]|jgi:DNA repair protein RecO (recombination protein O)